MNFTLVFCNNPAFGINKYQCGPGANGILSPDAHASIIHHRMTNAVAQYCIANTIGKLLTWELRRVHTHHTEFIGEGRFKLTQLRERVHTVYSAQRPEVHNQDAAA